MLAEHHAGGARLQRRRLLQGIVEGSAAVVAGVAAVVAAGAVGCASLVAGPGPGSAVVDDPPPPPPPHAVRPRAASATATRVAVRLPGRIVRRRPPASASSVPATKARQLDAIPAAPSAPGCRMTCSARPSSRAANWQAHSYGVDLAEGAAGDAGADDIDAMRRRQSS